MEALRRIRSSDGKLTKKPRGVHFARLLENVRFWVASAAGSTEFLLVGSISNAVGGRIDQDAAAAFNSGGPSADPLSVIGALIDRGEELPETGGPGSFAAIISHAWSVIVLGGTRYMALEDLPSVTGIAQSRRTSACARSDLAR